MTVHQYNRLTVWGSPVWCRGQWDASHGNFSSTVLDLLSGKSIEKRGRECGYPAVWKAFKNKTIVKLKKNHDSGHRIRVRVHLGGYFHTCSQLTWVRQIPSFLGKQKLVVV